MTHGKYTCRILKEIRAQIAQANDIEFTIEECQYKGNCRGTCPRCEAEVRYLEQQLNEKRSLGKSVSLVGLSLSIAALSTQVTSCGTQPSSNNTAKTDTTITDTLNIIESEEDTIYSRSEKSVAPTKKEGLTSYTEISYVQGLIVQLSPPEPDPVVTISIEEFENIKKYLTDSLPAPVTYAEEPPTFQGKDFQAFRKWCNEKREYPLIAIDYGVEGRVHVLFVVECDGCVSNVKVIRGADRLLDSAAIEVVERSPRWSPARDKGRPVRFIYSVAIDFFLE